MRRVAYWLAALTMWGLVLTPLVEAQQADEATNATAINTLALLAHTTATPKRSLSAV